MSLLLLLKCTIQFFVTKLIPSANKNFVMAEKKSILMICLGNICRSPIAEAIMLDVIQRAGKTNEWHVDSAAIDDYHAGSPPDERAMTVMEKNGLIYTNHARQIGPKDFAEFDYLFGMDDDNIHQLKRLAPTESKAKILMLGDFGLDTSERIIEDPYYFVGEAPFEKVFEQCAVACKAFFKAALAGKV